MVAGAQPGLAEFAENRLPAAVDAEDLQAVAFSESQRLECAPGERRLWQEDHLDQFRIFCLQTRVGQRDISLKADTCRILDFEDLGALAFDQQLIALFQTQVGLGDEIAVVVTDNAQQGEVHVASQAALSQCFADQRGVGQNQNLGQIGPQSQRGGEFCIGAAVGDQAVADGEHVDDAHDGNR